MLLFAAFASFSICSCGGDDDDDIVIDVPGGETPGGNHDSDKDKEDNKDNEDNEDNKGNESKADIYFGDELGESCGDRVIVECIKWPFKLFAYDREVSTTKPVYCDSGSLTAAYDLEYMNVEFYNCEYGTIIEIYGLKDSEGTFKTITLNYTYKGKKYTKEIKVILMKAIEFCEWDPLNLSRYQSTFTLKIQKNPLQLFAFDWTTYSDKPVYCNGESLHAVYDEEYLNVEFFNCEYGTIVQIWGIKDTKGQAKRLNLSYEYAGRYSSMDYYITVRE